MPKKINALVPSEREKECDHALGFPYRARFGMPCTGPRICPMCGARKDSLGLTPEPPHRWFLARGEARRKGAIGLHEPVMATIFAREDSCRDVLFRLAWDKLDLAGWESIQKLTFSLIKG